MCTELGVSCAQGEHALADHLSVLHAPPHFPLSFSLLPPTPVHRVSDACVRLGHMATD